MASADRPTGRYRVNSLTRGLAVLKSMHELDGPVRNREIVQCTGLPKATVSRIMGTLSAKGYLRRLDSQGSYVIGQASSRTGRVMLQALRLERHGPLLLDRFGEASVVWLHAQAGGRTMRVFRWSSAGATLLATDSGAEAPCPSVLACFAVRAQDPNSTVPCEHVWDQATRLLEISTSLDLGALGFFVLTLEQGSPTRPSAAELACIGRQLQRTAAEIAAMTVA